MKVYKKFICECKKSDFNEIPKKGKKLIILECKNCGDLYKFFRKNIIIKGE